jgi:branched-chain amino acid transport system permease protein
MQGTAVLVSGLTSGSFYGLLAAGFGLIFFVTGRFHYAYGVYFALAGVLAGWGSQYHGWNVWLAAAIGVVVGAGAGILTEVLVYRSFDKRSASFSLLGVFIASLGIVVAVEAAMQLWLAAAPTYTMQLIPYTVWHVGSVAIPEVDVVIAAVSWAGLIGLSLFVSRTTTGRKMRAVAANRDLAVTFGINVRRIFVITFVLGSLAAAVLGVLYTSQYASSSTMGDSAIVYCFVIVFLARTGGPLKWGLIGLILGVGVAFGGQAIGEVWEQPLVFGVLFVLIGALPFLQRIRESRPQLLRGT